MEYLCFVHLKKKWRVGGIIATSKDCPQVFYCTRVYFPHSLCLLHVYQIGMGPKWTLSLFPALMDHMRGTRWALSVGLGSVSNGNCVYVLKMDNTNGAHLGLTDELENTCGARPAPKCNPASNPHGKTHMGNYHRANIKAVDSPSWVFFFFRPFTTHKGPTCKCWLGCGRCAVPM